MCQHRWELIQVVRQGGHGVIGLLEVRCQDCGEMALIEFNEVVE